MKSKSYLEQASSLYLMNQEVQMLDIFVNNDTFLHFDLSMLKCTGGMAGTKIYGFEMINNQTLRLQVGRPAGADGVLTIDADAFAESHDNLAVDVKLKRPEIYLDTINAINEINPIVSFSANVVADHRPQLSFEFGGVLEGMTVTGFDWIVSAGILMLSGRPKTGMATLRVKGMFEAETEFRVVVLNSTTGALHTGGEIETVVSGQPETLDEAGSAGSTVGKVVNLASSTGKVASAIPGLSGVGTVMSVVSSTFDIVKTLDGLFNWGLFPDPNEKFKEEFGKINTKLDILDSKIDEINAAVKANMQLMIAGFNELEYNILNSLSQERRNALVYFLQQYNNILTKLEGDTRDNKLKNLLNIESSESITEAKHIIFALNSLLNLIDPYDKENENHDSLTYKYFIKVKSGTPFYHTSAQLLVEYTIQRTAELVRYSIIAGLIYNNNILFHPEYAPLYKHQLNEMMDRIKEVSGNIAKFFADKGDLYFDAYDNLVVYDFERDNLNLHDYEKYGTGILLVLNRSGKQWLFDNIGNTVAWRSPYPGSTFLRKLEIFGNTYYNAEMTKEVNGDFFSGANSIFTLFGEGMSLNDFLAKYIDGEKTVWLRPQNIIIESYEYTGKAGAQTYEEALLADANSAGYTTRKIKSSDCLNDNISRYARVFCLNGTYEIRGFKARSFVKTLSFITAATPKVALGKMKKASPEILAVIETTNKQTDQKDERVYIGYGWTPDRKEAITDLFVYRSMEKDAPKTITKHNVVYQKLDVLLNKGDEPRYGYKWIYYTKDQRAGFPVRDFESTGYPNLNRYEVKSEDGERISFTMQGSGVLMPRYLFCKR